MIVKSDNQIQSLNQKDSDSQKRIIEIVPHKPSWKKDYQKEANKIIQIFKDIIIDVHHIGSTAIKGIKAKPTIDIIVEVRDIEKVDLFNSEMEDLGYIPKGENGIRGRRYFQKGKPQHTHHIHVFETGNKEIKRHINFRDYMNSHPEEAEKYSILKGELAKKYRHDSISYTEGKSEFIQEIDRKANEWKQKR